MDLTSTKGYQALVVCFRKVTSRYELLSAFALAVTLLSACDAGAAGKPKEQPQSTLIVSTKQDATRMANDDQKEVVARPPTPSSVLYFIYQKDGDGASSYEIENGSWATYWYGHSFDLDGKHYFTGFAYQTPEKFGKSAEEEYPDPDAKAVMTQATYVLDAPGTDKPWAFESSQRFVGELGGYEKANEVDETRKLQDMRTATGKLLLAIPTWYLASGARVSSYEVFVFNPAELLAKDDKRWSYLGSILSGEDNSAACGEDSGGDLPCVKRSGILSFEPQNGEHLPLIRIRYDHPSSAAADSTADLEEAEIYRYDPALGQYQ